MEIKFEIKSRGSMRIQYGKRVAMISGELTFEPPVFYADLTSLKNWEPPFENESVKDEQKKEIITVIERSSSPTKIVFE
jgi:hypothetical protein